MSTRHDCGTDYERALLEFGTHRELPANRQSAAEAIARHAAYTRSAVAEVYWMEYDDDRIRPVVVHFDDGSRCTVSWGWVAHYDVQVPGAEGEPGWWVTWLPENRRQDHWRRPEPEFDLGQCGCSPGLLQPLGSGCTYCGEPIGN